MVLYFLKKFVKIIGVSNFIGNIRVSTVETIALETPV